MDDKGITNQEEGYGRPQVMATVVQVERGERVGKDVGQRQDRVEDEEETYLYVVLQEAEHYCLERGRMASTHAAEVFSVLQPAVRWTGRFLIRTNCM